MTHGFTSAAALAVALVNSQRGVAGKYSSGATLWRCVGRLCCFPRAQLPSSTTSLVALDKRLQVERGGLLPVPRPCQQDGPLMGTPCHSGSSVRAQWRPTRLEVDRTGPKSARRTDLAVADPTIREASGRNACVDLPGSLEPCSTRKAVAWCSPHGSPRATARLVGTSPSPSSIRMALPALT